MNIDSSSTETVNDVNVRSKCFTIGSILLLAGVFCVALTGPAVKNILFLSSVFLLFLSKEIRCYCDLFKKNTTIKCCVALFVWLGISMIWSSENIFYCFGYLNKYYEFIVIPIFMIYFTDKKNKKYAFMALYISLMLSLVASFLIHFNIVDISSNANSLGNRIFHGITMSFFGYMNMWIFSNNKDNKKLSIICIVMYLLIFLNVFFIEPGRTGCFTFLLLACVFFFQKINGWKTYLAISVFVIVIASVYLNFSGARLLNNMSIFNGTDAIAASVFQQADIRFEYYLLSTHIFLDNILFGVGLGSFSSAYILKMADFKTFWPPTTNPHNEFLMLACQSGVIGLGLFFGFFVAMYRRAQTELAEQRHIMTAVLVSIFTACLFNSSFLDYGDGSFFMILVSLFFV